MRVNQNIVKCRGKDHCAAGLQFSKIRLDQTKKIYGYSYVLKHLNPFL